MEERSGAVHLEIAVDSDDAVSETHDLCGWLEQDFDVRDYSVLELRPLHSGAGAMGAVEVIDLVLGQGTALLNLALAWATWRTARATEARITVTRNGSTVTLHGDCDPETVCRVLEALGGAQAEPRPPVAEVGSGAPRSEAEAD